MKKLLFISVLALSLVLVACTNSQTPATSEVSSTVEESVVSDVASSVSEEIGAIYNVSPEVHVPADAGLYRGSVSSISATETGYALVLKEYAGTDYGSGADAINVTIDANSRLNIEPSEIVVGDYLEVYYGGPIEAGIDEALAAIGVKHIGSAESSNYNGIVKSIEPNPEKEGSGAILMTDLDGENETVFNYDTTQNTQFYLNFDELKEGSRLNIFHSQAVANSMPPQIFAMEIRPLAE